MKGGLNEGGWGRGEEDEAIRGDDLIEGEKVG